MNLSRLGWVPRAVAAALVLLGVLAALGVLLTARSIAALESESETRAAAAEALPAVAATLRTTLEDTASGAGTTGQRIAFDEAESRGIDPNTAVRARDTGRPLLHQSGVVLVATYDSPTPPADVAGRRAAISGLYVVPLHLEGTIDRLRPDEGGILVSGPDRVVADIPGSVPEGATAYSASLSPVLVRDWTVTLWQESPGIPLGAWAIATAVLLLGLGAAALVLRREESATRTAEEVRGLRIQSTTVASLASVAQRSLDLADVLPALTTEVSDALGLRGLVLTEPTAVGERPFFSTGEAFELAESRRVPATVAAGERVAILLAQGGRTVARLHVLTGRPLDTHEVTTLLAVSEILSSALANAEAFAQQREVLQRLRALDELKTVFLATASHELRTPVGVITGFARLLSSKIDRLTPDQIRTYADRVDTNAQQLATLVENLLDFSRLERGVGLDSEQGVLDLGEIVGRILDQQPDLAADHVVTRQTRTGLLVRGTEQAVERVLTNLVGNAGKYSPIGTTIRVQVRERDGRAEMLVDDEGAGVPAADREQIFSRFFRGRGDAVVNTRGAGLGLAIVSEFAATMGGVVSVTAAPSGGARFVVSYPFADPEQSSEGESDVAS